MTEKTYRVRASAVHTIDEEGLRGLWRYHKEADEPFKVRAALSLFRDLMSQNPEVDVQIHEGLQRLEHDAEND